jgi:integrase
MKGHIRRGRVQGTWYLRVELPRDGSGKRRQMRCTHRGTRREAESRLRELLTLSENGGVQKARLTFVEVSLGSLSVLDGVCDKACALNLHEAHRDGGWLNATRTRVGHKTWRRYRQIVKDYLVPAFGEVRMEKLSPAHVEAAIASWSSKTNVKRTQKPLSARSVKHLRDTLRSLCRWAYKMEFTSRDVVSAVAAPRVEKKEMHTLSPEHVATLLKAAEGSELQAPIAVLVGTGLRRGELLGLRWADIDFEGCRLYVRRSVEMVDGRLHEKPPKTARSARTLSIAPLVIAMLKRQKQSQLRQYVVCLGDEFEAHRKQMSGYVFDRADGSTWRPDSFSWAFAALVRRTEIPRVRLHDLRHSHATLSLQPGPI